MPHNPFNPTLDLLLRELIPGLRPNTDSFTAVSWYAFGCSSSLHPPPARLNHIKVWGIRAPKKPLDFMKIVNVLLIVMCVCWSIIFLNYCTRARSFTFLSKRNQLRDQDRCLIAVPVNPTSRFPHQLAGLLIPLSNRLFAWELPY
jgi:hypothetical protein